MRNFGGPAAALRKLELAAPRRLKIAALAIGLVIVALAGWLLLRPHEGSLKVIRARGAWRVATDPSFPPFENLDTASGQVVGLDADLARGLGSELKIKTEIVGLGFDELLDAVAAHRVDAAISALPVIPERTQDVRFSEPYVQAGVVLAVPTGSAIRGTGDLAGKRVAVEWGSQGDAEARKLLAKGDVRFELAPSDTVTEALDATVGGDADAAIVDAISLALHPRTAELRTVGEPLLSDPYVVVVAYDSPDLLRAVNQALAALESDGRLEALRKQWLRPPNP